MLGIGPHSSCNCLATSTVTVNLIYVIEKLVVNAASQSSFVSLLFWITVILGVLVFFWVCNNDPSLMSLRETVAFMTMC